MSTDFEKKQEEAAEIMAKEISQLRTSVEGNVEEFRKLQKDLKDMQEATAKFMETSAWQEKFSKFEERMAKLDEEILRTKRPTLVVPDSKERNEMAMKAFFKNVHWAVLTQRESRFSDLFKPDEEELKLLKRDEKQFKSTQFEIPAFSIDVENKAAHVTDNLVRAGALVGVPEYLTTIIDQAVREFSPIRQYAEVRQTTRNYQESPKKTAHAIGYWTGKEAVGTATEDTTLAYGLDQTPLHQEAVKWKVSQDMLEDSIFNLKSEFMIEFPEALDVLEGTAFVNGSGSGEPMGFMFDPSVTAYKAQGHASLIHNGDALVDMPYQLKERYARDARYFMRRATMGVIAQLKDGVGNYLLTPLGEKSPWTIRGYQVIPTPDMPAITANAYPVVFADLKRGYKIIDKVVGQQLITDPYTSKDLAVVEFVLRRRVGGQVKNSESFIKLKISTT